MRRDDPDGLDDGQPHGRRGSADTPDTPLEHGGSLQINEPKFVDEFDDEALKFLTLVDGWSLSACPALVVCCA